MLLRQILFIIMAHVLTEPCEHKGVTSPDVIRLLFNCLFVVLVLSSGDLTNTSSQICGSWYLPLYLFKDGSLTLISIASMMALAMLWSSLPTMLKLSIDASWPVMLKWSCMGDGALICSLKLSANILPDSPIYSSSQ